MRIRLRRCPHMLRECLIKVLAYVLVGVSICHRNIYAVLGVLFFTLFLWWGLGDSSGCNGPQIVEQVCREYREKYVSGSLCPDLCTSKELTIGSCYSNRDHVMSFSKGGLVFRVVSNPLEVWQQDRLDEGLEFGQFTAHLDELLREQLGKIDTTSLINQLIFDFDDNKDDKINLGEAQNIWRLLKQPYFLNYYLFQDSGSVPHLNGTCGGISIWHYYPLFSGKALYSKTTPWPVSLFTNHAYRWTLPGWLQRAKVMLSLVELVEDLYEKDGVRYHLCNVNGLSLRHVKNFEVIVTEDTQLISSQQIRSRLSNITCHHSHDCKFTQQCQTTCNLSTRQCTDMVTQPTISLVCDIMEDYLLFDAPRLLKTSLTHLVRRCQKLSLSSLKADLAHSAVLIDLKNILWNHIQYKVK